MSARTKIEWTRGDDGSEGRSWNPLTGCTVVSPGCENCYAKIMHERFHGRGSFDTITLHDDKVSEPFTWRKPARVFVNSMSDLFHKDVPDKFIARVFAVMALTPQHTYQLLTKRHARMRSLLSSDAFTTRVADAAYLMAFGEDPQITGRREAAARRTYLGWEFALPLPSVVGALPWPLSNVWTGVSAETQQWADVRIPALLETPAAVRWVSAEPLLGPLDLSRYLRGVDGEYGSCGGRALDWIVAGGESGRGARPMHPQWVRSLRAQCEAAGVAYFFKQWGSWTPYTRPSDSWARKDPGLWVCTDGRTGDEALAMQGGSWAGMHKVGKRLAGRQLDGRTHDEYPAAVTA